MREVGKHPHQVSRDPRRTYRRRDTERRERNAAPARPAMAVPREWGAAVGWGVAAGGGVVLPGETVVPGVEWDVVAGREAVSTVSG